MSIAWVIDAAREVRNLHAGGVLSPCGNRPTRAFGGDPLQVRNRVLWPDLIAPECEHGFRICRAIRAGVCHHQAARSPLLREVDASPDGWIIIFLICRRRVQA